MKNMVDYDAENLLNTREFCLRSLNSKLFGNYKDTMVTNLLRSDIEKVYPGIDLSNFNFLSNVEGEGESDLLVQNFGNLLEELPQLDLRFA
jgi:hypothetical protein